MKERWKLGLAGLVFVSGLALLFVFHGVVKPALFSQEVVRVAVALSRNETVTASDVVRVKVASDAIPDHVLADISQVIGKKTNVDLPAGTILTRELVDVEDLQPDASEGYFPIPRTAIYAVNGSLRARDEVDIYVMQDAKAEPGDNERKISGVPTGVPLLERVTVVSVRSDAGNMVMDTDRGNTNRRVTSTERISNVEVKISKEQGADLKRWIEEGHVLWIVRVS